MVFLPLRHWNCVLRYSFYSSCVCFCCLFNPIQRNSFWTWVSLEIVSGCPRPCTSSLGLVGSLLSSTQVTVNFLSPEGTRWQLPQGEVGTSATISLCSLALNMGGEYGNQSSLWGSLQHPPLMSWQFLCSSCSNHLLLFGSWGLREVVTREVPTGRVVWHSDHLTHSSSTSDGVSPSFLGGRSVEIHAEGRGNHTLTYCFMRVALLYVRQ